VHRPLTALVLASALAFGFGYGSSPAYAQGTDQTEAFYVVKNKETKQCSVATTPPTDTKKYREMAGGPYGSEEEAQKALEANKKCK